MNRLRIGLAVAGFILAVLGVAWDDRRLGWAAIALLTTYLILRLAFRERGRGKSDGDSTV